MLKTPSFLFSRKDCCWVSRLLSTNHVETFRFELCHTIRYIDTLVLARITIVLCRDELARPCTMQKKLFLSWKLSNLGPGHGHKKNKNHSKCWMNYPCRDFDWISHSCSTHMSELSTVLQLYISQWGYVGQVGSILLEAFGSIF